MQVALTEDQVRELGLLQPVQYQRSTTQVAFKFLSFFDPESIADVGAFEDNLVSSPQLQGRDLTVPPLRFFVSVGTIQGGDDVLPLQVYNEAALTPGVQEEAQLSGTNQSLTD